MRMIGRLRIASCRIARWCGVAGASCFLVTFAPWRCLLEEFLLGQQVVGEDPVQFPDLVELLQLGGGVVAEVADQFPDPGPVLLLHVGAVVLVARAGTG